MCCCGSSDGDSGLQFRDSSKRSCTDVLLFLLFVASFAASIVMLVYAEKGDSNPRHTIYGVDFKGQICGYNSAVKDLKYAAWPILPSPSTVQYSDEMFDIKICVPSCEVTNTDTANFPTLYESSKVWRYCVPREDSDSKIRELLGDASEQFSRLLADLLITWPVIAASALVALIFSFIYVKCMKISCCRTILVWGVILLLTAGGFLIGWGLIRYASEMDNREYSIPNRGRAAKITGWVVIGLTALFILIIFFLRKRISLALKVIGAAACALDQMKSLVLYPIVPFIFICGYMVYWIYTAIVLFSVKNVRPVTFPSVGYENVAYMDGSTTYNYYTWDTLYQKLFAYHFFQMLWVVQFVFYATYMVMAGAIGNWYFARPSPTDSKERAVGSGPEDLPYTPVLNSVGRFIRYHIGTVAFGALIIAIIRFIRAVFTYIQRKTRNAQNPCTRCLLCCVQCCLKCCQSCLEYISRNALVWCAIRGDNFCKSAFLAFGLIIQNLGRAAMMTLVGTFVLFFGKLCIALITTGLAALLVLYVWEEEVSSTIMPLVVIFILTYIIADLFMEVFETGLETMFLCFIGDPGHKHAPGELRQAFDDATSEAEARNAAKQAYESKRGGADYGRGAPQQQMYSNQNYGNQNYGNQNYGNASAAADPYA